MHKCHYPLPPTLRLVRSPRRSASRRTSPHRLPSAGIGGTGADGALKAALLPLRWGLRARWLCACRVGTRLCAVCVYQLLYHYPSNGGKISVAFLISGVCKIKISVSSLRVVIVRVSRHFQRLHKTFYRFCFAFSLSQRSSFGCQ